MTMSAATTTWRLVRPNGRPSRCLLSEIAGHTDVIVWNGPSIVLWERHQSLAEARHRADELWTVLVAYGCEPAAGEPSVFGTSLPFRRSCPDCHDGTGRVRHRRGGYLVVECGKHGLQGLPQRDSIRGPAGGRQRRQEGDGSRVAKRADFCPGSGRGAGVGIAGASVSRF